MSLYITPDAAASSPLFTGYANYRFNRWGTYGDPSNFIQCWGATLASPICPTSFSAHLYTLTDPITWYPAANANVTLRSYNPGGGTGYATVCEWSTTSPNRSYSPNSILGKGGTSIPVTITPEYYGTPLPADSWILTRGIWQFDVTGWINAGAWNNAYPMVIGGPYTIQLFAKPYKTFSGLGEKRVRFWSADWSSGDTSASVTVPLRVDCFWTISMEIGVANNAGGVAIGADYCRFTVVATRL